MSGGGDSDDSSLLWDESLFDALEVGGEAGWRRTSGHAWTCGCTKGLRLWQLATLKCSLPRSIARREG
jgi:hypothetical protein